MNSQTKIRIDCYIDECDDTHYLCKCGIVFHDKYNMMGCDHKIIIACNCGIRYYNYVSPNYDIEYNIPINNKELTFIEAHRKAFKPQAQNLRHVENSNNKEESL